MKNDLQLIVALGIASILAGCAHHEVVAPPQATDAERQAAIGQYKNCLIPYAKRLDDGRSDAKTIAQAMRGACPTEMGSVYETMSRGENNAVKDMMRQRLGSIEESSALQVVLDVRHSQIK